MKSSDDGFKLARKMKAQIEKNNKIFTDSC